MLVSCAEINFLQAFKEGGEEGFTHYFNLWYKPLCFFAFTYIKDNSAAEDIVEDSFIKVWSKHRMFDNEQSLKAYIYQTVYNACIRYLENKTRRIKHHSIIKQQSQTAQPPYITTIIKAETIHLLHNAINELPVRCRQVFTKMYIEERSTKEIAAEMNTTISTVKNQHIRGLKLLKSKLSPLSPVVASPDNIGRGSSST